MTDDRWPTTHDRRQMTLFADIALAALIDRAEARLCAAFADLAARTRPDSRVKVMPLAGGLAVYAGPGAPMNKVIGLGLGETLEEVSLEAVEAEWASRGETVRVELSTLDDGAMARMLTARGYRLLGFENVLGRRLEASDDPLILTPGLRIDRLAAEDIDLWIEVATEGFAHADEGPLPTESPPRDVLDRVFRDMSGVAGLVRYLASLDNVAVAAASMRLDGGLAQLCGAATLPTFRRRGIQTALTFRRLADARAEGCDLAVVTTQPGSKSQENSQRRGFDLLYARAILVRQWA
jgi:ribosomal protein S18 acetylase RimI-like enzyme